MTATSNLFKYHSAAKSLEKNNNKKETKKKDSHKIFMPMTFINIKIYHSFRLLQHGARNTAGKIKNIILNNNMRQSLI